MQRTPLDDPKWRWEHVYSIVDKEGQQRILNLNEVQRRILYSTSRRKMVLKARQFGVSTGCIICDLVDSTLHTPNITTCILAHEQDAIRKLFRIVHRALKFLDPDLKPVIDRGGGSKYELFFPLLNSRIYCDLEVRSDTVHKLHVSEAAFIDEEKLKATLQAVPLTGSVTLETTANGMGNMFYEMWIDPEQPYEKFFFPWFIFPEYRIETEQLTLTVSEEEFVARVAERYGVVITHAQIAYRRFKQKELGRLFPQEYPEDDLDCFLSSGLAAMDLFKVKQHMDKRSAPLYQDTEMKLFRKYNNAHLYALGADPAEGVGGDDSAIEVFDVTAMEQVATFAQNKIKPGDFAHKIDEIARLFWEPGRPFPLAGVERNNHGHAVLLELLDHIHYPNVYVGKDERPGWLSDKVQRPLALDTYIDAVENQTVKMHDLDTFRQCLTLVEENKKILAAEGKKDDRVLAGAIGVQMCIVSSASALYDNIEERIKV